MRSTTWTAATRSSAWRRGWWRQLKPLHQARQHRQQPALLQIVVQQPAAQIVRVSG